MLLDQGITEKGIGREKTHFGIFWASPRIPDVSGMIPDVSGMSGAIKPLYPFGPDRLVSSKSTQPMLSSSPRATEDFHQQKREKEISLEKACIKIEGPGTWISHHLLISPLKVP